MGTSTGRPRRVRASCFDSVGVNCFTSTPSAATSIEFSETPYEIKSSFAGVVSTTTLFAFLSKCKNMRFRSGISCTSMTMVFPFPINGIASSGSRTYTTLLRISPLRIHNPKRKDTRSIQKNTLPKRRVTPSKSSAGMCPIVKIRSRPYISNGSGDASMVCRFRGTTRVTMFPSRANSSHIFAICTPCAR